MTATDTDTAVRQLKPVEIRVLAALRAARERFVALADLVVDSDDPLFAVREALAVLAARGYVTSSDSRYACTGVGEDALDALPAAVRARDGAVALAAALRVMRTAQIKAGDIIEANVRGVVFCAYVRKRVAAEPISGRFAVAGFEVAPIDSRITYRSVRARQITAHWRKSRQSAPASAPAQEEAGVA